MSDLILKSKNTHTQSLSRPSKQQLIDDDQSDEPWKNHCLRHFEGRVPKPGETWRDLFARCERERDHRIEKIAKRIKKHEKKAIPVRQAKVVQEALPGGNRNRAISTVITKTIKSHAPSRHSLAYSASSSGGQTASTSTVVIRRETSASNGSSSKVKPKTAPLMQKSMALFKSRFRR